MTRFNLISLPSTAAMAGALFQGAGASNPRITVRFHVDTGMTTAGPVETALTMPEVWEIAITSAKQTDVNNLSKMEICGHVLTPGKRRGPFTANIDTGLLSKPGHIDHKNFEAKRAS